MRLFTKFITTALLLATTINVAVGKPAAGIELLQSPAWLIRDGTEKALTRDSEVRGGDVIRTGERARVRIGLEEGSDIRIGPNARVEIPELSAPEERSGLFEGLVSVLRGAFRFTTGEVGAGRSRSIDIRVGAVTAGIRGTDIWGKATDARDFVVLIEGEIEVGTRESSTRLTEAGTAYIQPKDGPARPRERIPMETIGEFALETEPVPERGRLTPRGAWQVNLDSLRNRPRAENARDRYHEAGYPVRLESVRVEGERWHRLLLAGADSRQSAEQWARDFERDFGVRGAWVQKR